MDSTFRAPEIFILIFQQCDSFRGLLPGAAACKFLDSLWRGHSASIIRPFARTEILGFDQALVAVWLKLTYANMTRANER